MGCDLPPPSPPMQSPELLRSVSRVRADELESTLVNSEVGTIDLSTRRPTGAAKHASAMADGRLLINYYPTWQTVVC
eukprot:3499282-Pyramimonas_sp.AAC.1